MSNPNVQVKNFFYKTTYVYLVCVYSVKIKCRKILYSFSGPIIYIAIEFDFGELKKITRYEFLHYNSCPLIRLNFHRRTQLPSVELFTR